MARNVSLLCPHRKYPLYIHVLPDHCGRSARERQNTASSPLMEPAADTCVQVRHSQIHPLPSYGNPSGYVLRLRHGPSEHENLSCRISSSHHRVLRGSLYVRNLSHTHRCFCPGSRCRYGILRQKAIHSHSI